MLDIEFASGTSVQFELKQPMEIEEVRELDRGRQPSSSPTALPSAAASSSVGDGRHDLRGRHAQRERAGGPRGGARRRWATG